MSLELRAYDISHAEKSSTVVLGIRYRSKWLFWNTDGRGWQLPSGCRSSDNRIHDTALRCLKTLFSGADYVLTPVSSFLLDGVSGVLFFTEVSDSAPLLHPQQCLLSDQLPDELADRPIQKRLYDRLQGWRNVQTNGDELWDVYDQNRKLTGRIHRRGDPLPEGDYHLTVHVWLQNTDGKFLITKRAPNKGYAGLWECTGGSALAGDDSLSAAIREVYEETGLTIDPKSGVCILQRQDWDWFNDVWLFRQNFDTDAVVLQPGETCDYRWASPEEILKMYQAGEIVPFSYLKEFLTGGIHYGKRY